MCCCALLSALVPYVSSCLGTSRNVQQARCFSLASQVARVVLKLHSNNRVLGSLTPRNILVDNNLKHVAVSFDDFPGASSVSGSGAVGGINGGSSGSSALPFMAPEQHQGGEVRARDFLKSAQYLFVLLIV